MTLLPHIYTLFMTPQTASVFATFELPSIFQQTGPEIESKNFSVPFCFFYVGEWGWGSRLEAWMKSHKSEVAIT